jgi:hypothetical protein
VLAAEFGVEKRGGEVSTAGDGCRSGWDGGAGSIRIARRAEGVGEGGAAWWFGGGVGACGGDPGDGGDNGRPKPMLESVCGAKCEPSRGLVILVGVVLLRSSAAPARGDSQSPSKHP